MSIINQMLKDIDQRERQNHSGGKANYVYSGSALRSRRWLWALGGVGLVVVVFALIALVMWASSAFNTGDNAPLPTAEQMQIERMNAQLEAREAEIAEIQRELNAQAERTNSELNNSASNAANTGAENRAENRARARQVAVPVVPEVIAENDSVSDSQADDANNVSGLPNAESAVVENGVDTQAANNSANLESTDNQNPNRAAGSSDSSSAEANSGAGEMSIQRSDSRTATAPALYRRGMESLEAGNGREAMQRFQEALLVDGEYHDARLQLAALQFGRGFAADALELLRDGLARAPTNTEFLLLKARIYDRIEQPGFALELLRDVDAQLPRDADILLMRANLASDAGDYALAVSSYQPLVAWRSDQGNWWLGYGYALEQLAQSQGESTSEYTQLRNDAAEAYRRALQDARLSSSAKEFVLDRREALTN
ncbi:hypothetical protein CWE08_02110 [Aliidiomarina iranensis]|uniref:Uncharacterized protein n=1 Tax=Aliidiomarina iranensis TaxID=1434071 RepID=A0A432W2K3_9GAMM|nr:tetratricopeptide repeat protein [Aliidiomarina iranensis]RUO23462.1 hypothetical protein CWE08_02110 [Aliidiomarina iranensis]